LEQQLHTYVDEQIARFINGQNNMDSDWDRFIRRIERLGAERLEEIYNTAMNRYLDQAGIKL
jgi:putative aldouronate transport system substrate-binding protein